MKKRVLGALLAASFSMTANAGIIEQTVSVDYQNTDFTELTFSFEQFDDLGGTRVLDSINFTLFGEILNTTQVENFSGNSGSLINIFVGALLGLETQTGQELVTTLPSLTREFQATSYDGQFDWGGTSGATFEGLYSSNESSRVITDEAITSLFVGDGMIDTYLSGIADTRATGGGNIFSGFSTDARSIANVTYNYSDVEPKAVSEVSEPEGLLLFASGLLGFAALRRRKA